MTNLEYKLECIFEETAQEDIKEFLKDTPNPSLSEIKKACASVFFQHIRSGAASHLPEVNMDSVVEQWSTLYMAEL